MIIELITGILLLLLFVFLLMQNRCLFDSNRALRQQQSELEKNVETDPLTGLSNRFAMIRLRNVSTPIEGVVAVLDLDDMKRVNDELGHLAGDEVLAEVGNLIRASIRREDVACRWGGDEFVVLFRGQKLAAVEARMRYIQQRLWRFRLRAFGVFPLSISWGTAEADNVALADALAEADNRMYQMKRLRKTERPRGVKSEEASGLSQLK